MDIIKMAAVLRDFSEAGCVGSELVFCGIAGVFCMFCNVLILTD